MSDLVLHPGPTSAEVIQDIFRVHFPGPRTVLDLTFGKGIMWKKWDWRGQGIVLTANDLYAENPHWPDVEWRKWDFTNARSGMPNWNVVLLDPPHSAMGPDSQGNNAHSETYGAGRHQGRGLKGYLEVERLLSRGTREACRLAIDGVIIKTRDVVEGGVLRRSTFTAETVMKERGWRVKDEITPTLHGRPQPDKARGITKISHFRQRPSSYLVGVRE